MMINWAQFLKQNHYEQTLKMLAQGTLATNRQLIQTLQKTELSCDPADIYKMTTSLCELVTKQSYIFNVNIFGPSYWREDLLKKPYSNGLMIRVLRARDAINHHVFMLYEDDFGSTRETILYLDSQKPPDNVPYLSVIIRNALRHIFDYQKKEDDLNLITQLFDQDQKLIRWCEEIKSQGHSLKHFAGQTNTRMGFYHHIVLQTPEVLEQLIPQAEFNIDLGGGFATPEISRLLGQSFTSYDLVSPKKSMEWNIHFDKDSKSDQFTMEESEYYKALEIQPFHEFDVFKNSFPSDKQTYNIVSFGFLNSTVRSLSEEQPETERTLKQISTTFFAVLRVVELAAQGKDVCLLTFGRPHLPYMNRLIVVRFKNNKVESVTIPKKYSAYRPFTTADEYAITLQRDDVKYFAERLK